MKCILIDPPRRIVNIAEGRGVKEASEQVATYPPIGLAYIAAVLRENGIDVGIVDAKSLNLSHKGVAEDIAKEAPDFVGITAFTSVLRSALDLCKEIKELSPTTKVVVGGPHIHSEHEEVIKEDFIDFCVRKEGEYTMLELVDAVSNGADLEKVRGLTFKKGNEIIVTPDRPFTEDLNSLPFPARDLLPNHVYKAESENGLVTFTAVSASRGCPFKCRFCAVPQIWPNQRRRSPENVLDELEDIYQKYNIDFVRFTDEVFTLNHNWVGDICRGMIERGLNKKIGWSCDSRVDTVSQDLLKEMKQAGCEIIFYGIEFGNQRILHFSGKKTTLPQIHEAVLLTKEAGISPHANFMLGYPTETRETIEDTIVLARTVGVDSATFTIVTPFPATRLYDYCKENNLLKTLNWEEYNYTYPQKSVIKLGKVTDSELKESYQNAYLEFNFRYIRDEVIKEMSELFS